MHRTIFLIPILSAAMALGACGSGRPIRYYTVDLPAAPPPATSVYPVALLIGHIGGPEILMDQPIAFRVGANQIGTYQYHLWDEPPVQMLKISLVRRLRATGKYQSVAELGSSARGDYVLQGRLYDFEEVDAGGMSGLVSMEFELYDRKDRKLVWSRFYSHSEPVQGKDIADVVSALDRNLRQGLDELVSGLDGYFSANLHAKP
ncbi:MAG TPA: ABC-type transport auxiliary lipoprotein family protein [Terriglobia bacterium]|nr:ABC-type transport auxiliary lipoprotein family protein [Terriglobia bacterium]